VTPGLHCGVGDHWVSGILEIQPLRDGTTRYDIGSGELPTPGVQGPWRVDDSNDDAVATDQQQTASTVGNDPAIRRQVQAKAIGVRGLVTTDDIEDPDATFVKRLHDCIGRRQCSGITVVPVVRASPATGAAPSSSTRTAAVPWPTTVGCEASCGISVCSSPGVVGADSANSPGTSASASITSCSLPSSSAHAPAGAPTVAAKSNMAVAVATLGLRVIRSPRIDATLGSS
jgi:hypothetical protein